MNATNLILIRHGETEWSRDKKHTGLTDVPLTPKGREQGLLVGARLGQVDFARVLTSPLVRAKDTCEMAGLIERAEIVDDLVELDYGEYEGRTTAEIREERPGWEIWRDGCPGGESLEAAARRVDRVLEDLPDGDVAVFAHGHILRVLAARWIGLGPEYGGAFPLETGALCRLGYEREKRAILRWNAISHMESR